jgi:hypothetical protein
MVKTSRGWRDAEGDTASERHKQVRTACLAHFLDRVKNRPLRLVRPALVALFFAILILAVAMRYF